MTNYRNKIHAKIPEPNDNVTMTMGNKTVVDAVFSDTGLDVFLDSLKRAQGNSVAAETAALVANSVEMTGISVSRIDRILEEDAVREEYGLDVNAPKSIYRTIDGFGCVDIQSVFFPHRILFEDPVDSAHGDACHLHGISDQGCRFGSHRIPLCPLQ